MERETSPDNKEGGGEFRMAKVGTPVATTLPGIVHMPNLPVVVAASLRAQLLRKTGTALSEAGHSAATAVALRDSARNLPGASLLASPALAVVALALVAAGLVDGRIAELARTVPGWARGLMAAALLPANTVVRGPVENKGWRYSEA